MHFPFLLNNCWNVCVNFHHSDHSSTGYHNDSLEMTTVNMNLYFDKNIFVLVVHKCPFHHSNMLLHSSFFTNLQWSSDHWYASLSFHNEVIGWARLVIKFGLLHWYISSSLCGKKLEAASVCSWNPYAYTAGYDSIAFKPEKQNHTNSLRPSHVSDTVALPALCPSCGVMFLKRRT